jgi:hypothetical protein
MLASMFTMLSFVGTPPELTERPAYLFKTQDMSDRATTIDGERYRAQPGDILLFDDHSWLTHHVYRFRSTGGPLHAGVVFRKADGSLAILEAGTNAVMKVFVFDLEPRLHSFDGTILVRRLRKPLDEKQADKLREFALAQEGKPYALGRIVLQLTPFRPRNAPLSHYFGGTVLDRDRWICSELVVASLANAGVWSPDAFPANMMYPRDLCYDERFDLSPYYELPAMWYPRPQLEYIGKGVRVIGPRER